MPAEWIWELDGWIVAAGILCAMSCALLGNFLVLRRMSMMGDAISHAVLPGLAAAFLMTGSRDTWAMLAGAILVGILTALLTQAVSQLGKVDESASMGVVFTALFALGLVLIRQAADTVDLDPGCVLYGLIESVWIDTVSVGGRVMPRSVLVLGVMFILNVAFVTVLYKELKLVSFDPALATTLGYNANVLHYLLMTMVAATTVVSFEAVGSILVVAMLIVPAAAAYLLTQRLGAMIAVSLVIAALCGLLGHVGAIAVPRWFGYGSTITAGMMAVVAGVILLGALLLAPRQGVLSKMAHRAALSLRIVAEDILGLLYRMEELAAASPQGAGGGRVRFEAAYRALDSGWLVTRAALWRLRATGRIQRIAEGYCLTDIGRQQAGQILRSHRLWERFLVEQAAVRVDHSHSAATRLEHVTTPRLQEDLRQATQDAAVDPHGRPIPRPPDRGATGA